MPLPPSFAVRLLACACCVVLYSIGLPPSTATAQNPGRIPQQPLSEEKRLKLGEADALSNKAFLQSQEGKFDEAISTQNQSLQIKQSVLGNQHADVAAVLAR